LNGDDDDDDDIKKHRRINLPHCWTGTTTPTTIEKFDSLSSLMFGRRLQLLII
jgi:hypothetical protein